MRLVELTQQRGEAPMLNVSEAWRTAYPGACAGILLVENIENPDHHAVLDRRKSELEESLRSQFKDRGSIANLPAVRAYDAYYKRFNKTYPVQLQLESVALKGKTIPRVAALVEAMFMAELKNTLLTAGHDFREISLPLTLDISRGTERYTRLNGQEHALKERDMMMTDARGVISCVVYGPDQRTQITPSTRQALFVVYAPAGIGEDRVRAHLADILANVRVVCPDAQVRAEEVHLA
ncbi:MAG: phenylalanine--tRNA ligase beta subunit-related protein [Ignavibacteriales bacterium]